MRRRKRPQLLRQPSPLLLLGRGDWLRPPPARPPALSPRPPNQASPLPRPRHLRPQQPPRRLAHETVIATVTIAAKGPAPDAGRLWRSANRRLRLSSPPQFYATLRRCAPTAPLRLRPRRHPSTPMTTMRTTAEVLATPPQETATATRAPAATAAAAVEVINSNSNSARCTLPAVGGTLSAAFIPRGATATGATARSRRAPSTPPRRGVSQLWAVRATTEAEETITFPVSSARRWRRRRLDSTRRRLAAVAEAVRRQQTAALGGRSRSEAQTTTTTTSAPHPPHAAEASRTPAAAAMETETETETEGTAAAAAGPAARSAQARRCAAIEIETARGAEGTQLGTGCSGRRSVARRRSRPRRTLRRGRCEPSRHTTLAPRPLLRTAAPTIGAGGA